MDDVRFKHPWTAVVSGPTKCGKSFLVRRFIKHLDQLVDTPIQQIIWCYGEWQPMYDELKEQVQFHEGLPDEYIIGKSGSGPRLIIIDDLMHESDASVSQIFTKGSHHRDISVLYIVQNLFGTNKHHRTISLNSHYLFVFKNPRDMSQIIALGKQMFPGNNSYLRQAFKEATSEPHGYLLIDLTQNTPDHLRLRTKIFPDQLQIVYLPK